MKGGDVVEGWGWTRKVQLVGKFPLQPSPVVKMVWSNEQHAFAVETYFSRSHSIIAVQRAFRTRYQIPPWDRVPDRKSILLWVENFRGTGSVSKKRRGRPRTSRTPENIEAVRRSVLQSPRRCARKHAYVRGISNRSVRQILHQDLHFHPYKMVVVQELTQQDWINRVEASRHLIEGLPDGPVVFFFLVMKSISIFQAVLISKTCVTGAVSTQGRSIRRPFIVIGLQCGAEYRESEFLVLTFFAEDDRAVTVNSERYVAMIQEFFFLRQLLGN